MKYEKWSFGYWLLKYYVWFADWIIHRKVIVLGEKNIPQKKPILFAPNHQNALSDPLAILLHTRYQPVWLARADIFKNKIVAAILKFLKIMPVYRMRDGKDNLLKNDETFEASIRVLENNFSLALFPEATHSGKRQMLPHKKAIPRIVFLAEENAHKSLDIQIIPTGIYYSSYWKFNRYVIVSFGNPIAVNDYIEAFRTNENNAVQLLRQRIVDEIEPLIIDIKSNQYYTDFENIREMYGRYFLKRQGEKYSEKNLLKSDRKLVKQLDVLEENNNEETEKLVQETRQYLLKIRKLKIRSWLLENQQQNVIKIIRNILVLMAGLPVFAVGFLVNAIPFFIIDTILRKKIKDISFWSSFSLVLGMVLFPVFHLVVIAVFWELIPGIILKTVVFFALPIFGKIAFSWYILGRKTVGRIRMLKLKIADSRGYGNLVKQRDLLYQKLDILISV